METHLETHLESNAPAVPSRPALFLGFLEIAAFSFGGAAAWARRILVEERKWLRDEEFTEALTLGQVLPGPNVINLSIYVGDRFHGPLGAILAFSGLMLLPTGLAIGVDVVLVRWGHMSVVQAALAGVGAAAAGLVIATGLKMGKRFRGRPVPILFAALALLAHAVLRLPLPAIVLGLGPVSIAAAWRARR